MRSLLLEHAMQLVDRVLFLRSNPNQTVGNMYKLHGGEISGSLLAFVASLCYTEVDGNFIELGASIGKLSIVIKLMSQMAIVIAIKKLHKRHLQSLFFCTELASMRSHDAHEFPEMINCNFLSTEDLIYYSTIKRGKLNFF